MAGKDLTHHGVVRWSRPERTDWPRTLPVEQHQGERMKVSLRPAVDADFEACRRTYFAETAWINERLQLKREDQEATFRNLWKPTQVCVIQADGVDVGWLQTVVSKDEEFLGQIFVDARFQNRGIGTEVLRRIIEEASRRALSVRLAVVKFNPSRRLYERLGFRVTHEDERKVYMTRAPDTTGNPG